VALPFLTSLVILYSLSYEVTMIGQDIPIYRISCLNKDEKDGKDNRMGGLI
jgi:hypothetical protein